MVCLINLNYNVTDRKLIEKMHQTDLNYEEPPERLFDFGKKNKRNYALKNKIDMDILYLIY